MKNLRWLLLLAISPLLSACSTASYLKSLNSHIEETDDFIKDRKAGWAKIEKRKFTSIKRNRKFIAFIFTISKI